MKFHKQLQFSVFFSYKQSCSKIWTLGNILQLDLYEEYDFILHYFDQILIYHLIICTVQTNQNNQNLCFMLTISSLIFLSHIFLSFYAYKVRLIESYFDKRYSIFFMPWTLPINLYNIKGRVADSKELQIAFLQQCTKNFNLLILKSHFSFLFTLNLPLTKHMSSFSNHWQFKRFVLHKDSFCGLKQFT